MKGEDIMILDAVDVAGGSLDGAGGPEEGYLIRGGREMNWNYDNLWDMFQDVQALELPEGTASSTNIASSTTMTPIIRNRA